MADQEQEGQPQTPTTPESPSMAAEQQAPTEPPKKKGIGKWIALGCAGLLILGLLVGGGIGIFVYMGYKSITKPIGTIKGQLQAFNDGDIEKAYGYSSNRFKQVMSYEQFKVFVEANSAVFKSKGSSFNNVKIENGIAKVEGTVTGQSDTKAVATYELVNENGEWKIQYFKIE